MKGHSLIIDPVPLEDLKPRPTVPIVPAGPYERVVGWLERVGCERQALLARAGITEDELTNPRGLLTVDQAEALALVGAEMVGKPGLILDLGGVTLFPSYGNMGLAALTAPSVAAAITVAERYLDLVTPLFVIEQGGDEQSLHVRLTTRYRLHPEAQRIHLEFVLSTLYGLARHGTGRVPEGIRLTLPTRNPRLYGWLEERGVTVCASEDRSTVLELPRALTLAPFVMADPIAHAAFVALCESAMSELEARDSMTRAVRAVLKQAGPPFPSFEDICRRVGSSARTLRRRLGEEGTGYQELLDEARFSWAKHALQFSRRPVTQIAYDLGYSAPSNFTRAFRRALGTSPSDFRVMEHDA